MVTKVGQENSRRSGFVMQMSKLVADWLGAGRRTPAGVVGENLHDLHISKKKMEDFEKFQCLLSPRNSAFYRISEFKLLQKCNGELRFFLS